MVISMPQEFTGYEVRERFVQSKTGDESECEDLIHVSEHFCAIVDGATSKTERLWQGKTGGRIAAEMLDQILAQLAPQETAVEAVHAMTAHIADRYRNEGLLEMMQADPAQRITASFCAVSIARRELWLVGDCQALVDGQHLSNEKQIDRIAADARALFLELELLKGKSVDSLLASQAGREFIMPLLREQARLQNNPIGGAYTYSVIDGFPLSEEDIRIHQLQPTVREIVLASDGFPELHPTLGESEAALEEILRTDPLLMRRHKSTKGMYQGWHSYDDRSYLRIRLFQEG